SAPRAGAAAHAHHKPLRDKGLEGCPGPLPQESRARHPRKSSRSVPFGELIDAVAERTATAVNTQRRGTPPPALSFSPPFSRGFCHLVPPAELSGSHEYVRGPIGTPRVSIAPRTSREKSLRRSRRGVPTG